METETYLTFVLDNDLFAVNVKNVLEVLEQQEITRVPKAPPGILGITNFRGQILPVVDTRHRFNMNPKDESKKNYVIVYEINKGDSNIIVSATADGVKDVVEIENQNIQPVPEIGLSYDAKFIAGAINKNGRFILLIKPDILFSTKDATIAE